MLGIVENLTVVLFQKRHGVRNHANIFLRSDIQDFNDMEEPSLTDDSDYGSLGLEEKPHLSVVFDCDAATASAAKGGDAGILPLEFRCFGKESGIPRIRSRPTTFNEIDTEPIQFLGYTDLIKNRKRYSRSLRSIPECRVVNRDRFHVQIRG